MDQAKVTPTLPPQQLVELTEAVAGLHKAVDELEVCAVAAPQKFVLKYAPGHPKEVEGLPNPLVAPYALCFDTVGMSVQDYHSFPSDTPLVAIKSVFINVIHAFAADYRNQVMNLFMASKSVAEKIGKNKPMIPGEMVDEALGRAQMAVERARERVIMWDGKGEFQSMLPYCIVVEQQADGVTIVDFQKSRLAVNGMIWCLRVEV